MVDDVCAYLGVVFYKLFTLKSVSGVMTSAFDYEAQYHSEFTLHLKQLANWTKCMEQAFVDTEQ